jgi:hypothetical protein
LRSGSVTASWTISSHEKKITFDPRFRTGPFNNHPF